jgi:hypothetical protein
MKKLIAFLAISLIGTGAFAQMDSMNNKMGHMKSMKEKNGVMMKDGKMMVMKDNQMMPMTSDMTMSNGTMVMTDGTVKMKSGKTMTLKNGECVYMNGKVGTMMKMGDKKMKRMPKDSI